MINAISYPLKSQQTDQEHGLPNCPSQDSLAATTPPDQQLTKNRTELVMFITPRVVENELDIRNVIDDLRRRMGRLEDEFPRAKSLPPPIPPMPGVDPPR